MIRPVYLFFYSITFFIILNGCKKESKVPKLVKIEKNIPVKEIVQLNGARWYMDFSKIKKTVLYKNTLISIGTHGGFSCINFHTLDYDSIFSKSLNTDFYMDIAVYSDTLFTQKNDRLFYLDSNNVWEFYEGKIRESIFNNLYEDDKYIFNRNCHGEFGSTLSVYYKESGKAVSISLSLCPNSIIKKDKEYIVTSDLSHLSGRSSVFAIPDVDSLQSLSEMLERLLEKRINIHSDADKIALRQEYENAFNKYTRKIFDASEVLTSSSFSTTKGQIVYCTMDWQRNRKHGNIDEYTYLTVIQNDSLLYLDSMVNFVPEVSYNLTDCFIINQEEGFTLVRNDTLYRINFSSSKYLDWGKKRSPHLYKNKLILAEVQDSISKILKEPLQVNINGITSLNKDTIKGFEKLPYFAEIIYDNYYVGHESPRDDITLNINDTLMFRGDYASDDHNYIYRNKTSRFMLDLRDRVDYAFVYNSHLFLYFRFYGLIEIEDPNKFLRTYCDAF